MSQIESEKEIESNQIETTIASNQIEITIDSNQNKNHEPNQAKNGDQ